MVWIGTSGYNYPEWKGSFYPERWPAARMLPYYASVFSTVEINYSFYRLPSEKTLSGWSHNTPEGFKFSLKAPRRITHDARLQRCDELVTSFCRLSASLQPKLGVLLFQLPPSFRKRLDVLDEFLRMLAPGVRAAFEFRHPSWFDDDVYDRLKTRNLALCIADSERMSTPVVRTADYGYFRLRDDGYSDADLVRWAAAIQDPSWRDVFVYFKHEQEGKGPALARQLVSRIPV